MLIYVLLVAAILILNIQRKNGRMSNRKYCRIICLLFILVTGLRHNSVGSDTTGYYFSFYDIAFYSFQDVLNRGGDTGFYILMWCVSRVWQNFAAMTLVIACIFYIPVSKLIECYSEDCGLSYLTLMAFNFFQFSMTGMRQTAAFGFAILFVLELEKKRCSLLKALLWLFIGATMHKSCLVAVLYFLPRQKALTRGIIKFSGLLIPIGYILRGQLFALFLMLSSDVGYTKEIEVSESGSAGMTTYLVFVLITLMSVYFFRLSKTDGEDMMLLAMLLGTIIQGLVGISSILFRVAWYFSIMMILVVPRLVRKFSEQKLGALASMGMYACVLYMYFGITIGSATVLPYKFFWQGY